jgi:general secretion pathway protein L
MNLRSLTDALQLWIRAVEAAIISALERFQRPRHVRLVEDDSNTFRVEAASLPRGQEEGDTRITIVDGTIADIPAAAAAALKGSRAELVLQSRRFLFRPLDVPQRAAEFVDGIVRAQIDRLTPWSANDAVFGWTTAAATAPERISLVICATARNLVMPYVNALGGLGIESIVVAALPEGDSAQAAPIRVLEDKGEGRLGHGRIRRGLVGVLLSAALLATAGGIANGFFADGLDQQKADLAHAISELRLKMRRDGAAGSSPAQQLLEQRKRATPSAVIVLEALSRILPDHTYVTELRIEGDKLQIIGVTHDAPELIRLIEQSPNFTRATFFAPTTSTAGEPGEHFHIEAQIKPVFAVGS